ncbi:putative glycosyltransferase EpsJ [Abditibacteriota bacterium]|nr:putative glycosyltransferase EpsJ [Abditibacteriota bacterium]
MNQDSPLLSIIIPLYNAAPYLEMAVQSIYRQDLATLGGTAEVIIVNDGSTDGSGEIARNLAAQHPEIKLVEQQNRGASSARNAGIKRARGEIICFLDADDEYPDGTLAFFLRELEALREQFGELVMVRGQVQYLQHIEADAKWQTKAAPVALSVVTANAQTHATIEKIGFFDEELLGPEDTDWLLRAEEQGIVMPLRECVTLLYRQHETNMTRDVAFMRAEKIKMLKKCLHRKHALRAGLKAEELSS